jgi:calcium binding protein 39
MPLFGKSQKSPQELVRSLKEALGAVVKAQAGEKKADKVSSNRTWSLELILKVFTLHFN